MEDPDHRVPKSGDSDWGMYLCACNDVVMCVAQWLVPETANASAGSPAPRHLSTPHPSLQLFKAIL